MPDLNDLLVKTSRTFGISIPLLPEIAREEVTLLYLLFRIADTFEDSTLWPVSKRISALHDFERILQQPSAADVKEIQARWVTDPPCDHEGYLELLVEMPFILEKLLSLSDEAREKIIKHTLRTSQGMASFLMRTTDSSKLQLMDIADLRNYCYVVAGIVGEALTDLFILHSPDMKKFEPLMIKGSHLFGEGLQLVNILKDSISDRKEGRFFLPPDMNYRDLFGRVQDDLNAGADYIVTLQEGSAAKHFMGFLALPLFLAWATLDRLERAGPGNKVSREEVAQYLACVNSNFQGGEERFSRESLRELYDSISQSTKSCFTESV
jgi:farnesyl-diphosphate farnesyltransferase